ncbi:hypothetical protein [Brumimicrobium aurantiacum]|nr:hypothetical protein [Brumimicrobium aurantiacum]
MMKYSILIVILSFSIGSCSDYKKIKNKLISYNLWSIDTIKRKEKYEFIFPSSNHFGSNLMAFRENGVIRLPIPIGQLYNNNGRWDITVSNDSLFLEVWDSSFEEFNNVYYIESEVKDGLIFLTLTSDIYVFTCKTAI